MKLLRWINRHWLNRLIEPTGYKIEKISPTLEAFIAKHHQEGMSQKSLYDHDGLRTFHNHEFMLDPAFKKAYKRGVEAAETDYQWYWRVHIGLWVAFSASKLAGDFVECGVNKGFLSSAIMSFLDWNLIDKTFYLLDTFCGLDERFVTDREIDEGALYLNKCKLQTGFYTSVVGPVESNFSEWKNVRIIQGAIPETLDKVETRKVAYLHLDLNCSQPEVAAMEFFWNRLTPGAFILMDDYASTEYRQSKLGMDAFANVRNLIVASLPTGQGLLIKPA